MRIVAVFGSVEETQDLGDAFWLGDTPSNRIVAERTRASGTTDPNSAVFKLYPDRTASAAVFGVFDNIDLHHPEWSEIRFLDSVLTPEISERFREMNLTSAATERGFVVTR